MKRRGRRLEMPRLFRVLPGFRVFRVFRGLIDCGLADGDTHRDGGVAAPGKGPGRLDREKEEEKDERVRFGGRDAGSRNRGPGCERPVQSCIGSSGAGHLGSSTSHRATRITHRACRSAPDFSSQQVSASASPDPASRGSHPASRRTHLASRIAPCGLRARARLRLRA
jgi:hypothetical protein